MFGALSINFLSETMWYFKLPLYPFSYSFFSVCFLALGSWSFFHHPFLSGLSPLSSTAFPWERLWSSMTGLHVSGLPSFPVAVSLGYSLWARRWGGGEASTPARADFPLNLASQADPWSNSDQVLFLPFCFLSV